ncbi:BTAD domain-containing putative transcriptional regulator [Nitrosomonas sp. Nm34]|uniref:BTAD domain-containing putative transcriptional regulator n=1 Tax=Nitrosomonas sp. Nm34 TaxID=1881055 RepID=UPI0008DF2D23|nr:BTAD domain-containing putative transcriptional regulator [Nitrosomonas sp. Nm34]SFI48809.1 transcriptional activator domain-containing protein [Nitrosomonas sp. Nm34]
MKIKRYPTKIMPPAYTHVFERTFLFELVKKRKSARIIWVNGSPGAGKTVFVASLLKKLHTSFLWYRIDSSENDVADIFYFLALAAQKNHPRKKLDLPVFTSEYADDVENFARIFFRKLIASLTKESAIVLDNCHELEKNAVFLRLIQIVENQLPQDMQLICISRNRLPAALKRLYTNYQLLDIGNAELEFNDKEGQAFLKWLDPHLNDLQIQQIQSKTHGWAAGIVLMAREFRVLGFTKDFNAEENIFDYLSSEILFHLPKELHKFLVASALFTQLTAEMGMQLTGCSQARSYLNELVSKNFLIKRIEKPNPTYQFHPLLRDLLLSQADVVFTPAYWRKLQRKAAIILVKQDSALEAMLLFQQLQDWPSLKELLLQRASQLINSGHHHTVIQWMQALPSKYLNMDAWIRYWYAIALKPVNPFLTEAHMEKCYQLFDINHDIKGIYSSWVAAVESIIVSWDDFSRLKVWMNRFDEIRKHYHARPSVELKIKFYMAAINGLTIYDPHHPRLKTLIRICERLFLFTSIKTIKLLLGTQLAQYYMFNCQLTKLHTSAAFLELVVEDQAIPVMVRIMSTYLLANQRLFMADTVKALEYTQTGLQLSELSGIRSFEGVLHATIIGCHINDGDLISAEMALQKAIKYEDAYQRISTVIHCSYAVWLAALAGKLHHALEQNHKTLQLAKSIHFKITCVSLWSLEVQILAELSQWHKAEQTLSLLSAAAIDTNNKHNLIQYHIADAWLAYLQQNQLRTLAALKELLQILHTEEIFAFFGWRPKVLISLCLLAIETGIEEEFAVRMLQKHRLLACPPTYLEKWPWPVRIYSFGSLIVEVKGKQIEHSGKSQKKILELLQTLVILGGRNVHSSQLTDILWPDVDGDLARQSLETALHRLRKLLGKEVVILNSGLVSLNSSYCWLDLWAFEATIDELEQALTDERPSKIIKLTDRLLKFYRGPFLKDSDSGLGILKQSQLLNKLSRALDLSISFYEKNGEYDRVYLLLNKAVELNPLTEENYRRLMSYHIRQGQPDQALQTYHRCHRILFEGFKIRLSNKILELAKQLKREEGYNSNSKINKL